MKDAMETLIAQLHDTGLFDPEWYCATYPDVAQTGLDPMWHFVKYGLDLDRRPGPGFDPKFYRERYRDVGQSGDVALRHYLRHGRGEGRLTTPQAAMIHAGMTRVRQLQAELWGGLEVRASAALIRLFEDPSQPDQVRLEAGCQLASWVDFDGQSDRARQILERMEGMPKRFSRSALRLIPLAMLYARQGQNQAAQMALETIDPAAHGADSAADQTLALANLAATATDRLAQINRLYQPHDLALLQLKKSKKPLSFAALTSAKTTCTQEDIGMVSVIMPVYQAVDHLALALDSLQRQSYQNLELIVVDDASTDGSYEKLVELAKTDPRIVPLRQDENGGAYRARNQGLTQAKGAFITTHDADDWSHPQKIECQLKALAQSPDAKAVISHWARCDAAMNFTTNWRLGPKLLQWSHSSFLFHKAVADALGPWDEVRVSGDMEYIWRVQARFGPDAVRRILPDVPLAFALDQAASLTRNPATHVRTTYHGLRHYYREICRYWHAQAPAGLDPAQQKLKHHMLPKAILPGQDGRDQVDLLLRGDCCDPNVLTAIERFASSHPTRRIGLSHVPNPNFGPRQTGYAVEFPVPFFELLKHKNIAIACPEDHVEARKVHSL